MKCEACGKDGDLLVGGACSWECHEKLYPRPRARHIDLVGGVVEAHRAFKRRLDALAERWERHADKVRGEDVYQAQLLAECADELREALRGEREKP